MEPLFNYIKYLQNIYLISYPTNLYKSLDILIIKSQKFSGACVKPLSVGISC